MTTSDDASGSADRRIIYFRPRSRIPSPTDGGKRSSLVSDLAEFERPEGQDDYRHRMIVNTAALAFTLVLAAAGVWIADSMATIRKNQDCVLMGRPACAQVPAPSADRWSSKLGDVRLRVNDRRP